MTRKVLSLFIVIAILTFLFAACGTEETISGTKSDDIGISVEESIDNSTDSSATDESSINDESSNLGVDKEIQVLFDSSDLKNYTSPFLPSYAPFSLYDTTVFSDTVITSISFPFSSFANGYSADSEGLIMPVYVIKNDFSSKKPGFVTANTSSPCSLSIFMRYFISLL